MLDKIKKLEKYFPIIYKLGTDILFVLLLVFAMLLFSERVLPGFLSNTLSFTRITIILFINIGLLIYIGKKENYLFSGFTKRKHGLPIFFVIFATVLIAASMLKFQVWEIIIITATSIMILCYFYKIIFNPQD
jgi:hypothetical protein